MEESAANARNLKITKKKNLTDLSLDLTAEQRINYLENESVKTT